MPSGLRILTASLLASLVASTQNTRPIAPHQLYVTEPGGVTEVHLTGYDLDGNSMAAKVTDLPTSGELFQLSKVYSDYGYEPKQGSRISRSGVTVTGSKNRMLYKRPVADRAKQEMWSRVKYTVNDGRSDSNWGYITFVPPSGVLVGSDFSANSEGWTVYGNKRAGSLVSYDTTSRGRMNQYVFAADDIINVDAPNLKGSNDFSLWYFDAPTKYTGHHGISYGGSLEFTLSSFAGDFSGERNTNTNLVVLECAQCAVNSLTTIVFPLEKAGGFQGGAGTKFIIPLKEDAGWLFDPENTLIKWSKPTKCQFIEALSGISSLRILGDFTRGYETVGLDNVALVNTKGQVPICAQGSSDASTCTC